MVNNNSILAIVREIQPILKLGIKNSGLTYLQVAQKTGRSDHGEISRILIKSRMSLTDTVRFMYLSGINEISFAVQNMPGYQTFGIASNLAPHKPEDLAEKSENLSKKFRLETLEERGDKYRQLPNGGRWEEVAEIAGFYGRMEARRSWMVLNTPLYVVIAVLVACKLPELSYTDPDGSFIKVWLN